MIFAAKRFLDADIEDWHIACWEWLLFHLGGIEALKQRALVLPTPVFLALRGNAPDAARTHLKEHLAKKLDAACKRLSVAPELLMRLRDAPTRSA